MTVSSNYSGLSETGAIQFENSNELRSYPFVDNATLVSDDGHELDEDVVADMHLVVPKVSEASLSSVYLSQNMVSVCVRVVSASGTAALSCTVCADAFEPYVPYRLEKLAGSEDVGGIVTFGQVEFPSSPVAYRFSPGKVPLAASAVAMYEPAGLRRIVDDRTGKSVSGDVSIRFSGHVVASREEGGVRLSLRDGSNKALLSDCDKDESAGQCGATPVGSINGVLPDDQGRLVIWFH